jgi:S1-C subfamily serine protease
MPFVDSYRAIEPCIVAIANKFSRGPFPEIIGTGFFTSEDGVVCTCRHVVDAFATIPRPDAFAGIPADVLLFREIEIDGRRKWAWFTIEILAAGNATFEGERPDFVPADEDPDTSFLLVNAVQTPSVSFSENALSQGEAVAFAGFPMGTTLLRAPTGFRQLSPSLHSGVVSAIFPDRVAETSYGFLLHANTQGGASGSPVFRADGNVCGMVYMGLRDVYTYNRGGGPGVTYEVPTSLTGCISGRLIRQSALLAGQQAREWEGRLSLADRYAAGVPVDSKTGAPIQGQIVVI